MSKRLGKWARAAMAELTIGSRRAEGACLVTVKPSDDSGFVVSAVTRCATCRAKLELCLVPTDDAPMGSIVGGCVSTFLLNVAVMSAICAETGEHRIPQRHAARAYRAAGEEFSRREMARRKLEAA